MSNANRLHFSLVPTDVSNRLTLCGPTDCMDEAFVESLMDMPEGQAANGKVYKYQHNGTERTATWSLNAMTIGRIRNESVRNSYLRNANNFLLSMIGMSHGSRAEPDARIDLSQFSPHNMDFAFIADVARPTGDPIVAQRAMAQGMTAMAADLRIPNRRLSRRRQPTRAEAETALRLVFEDATRIDDAGVHTTMPSGAEVYTPDSLDPKAERIPVAGRNLNRFEEPLIALAGLVAAVQAGEH